MNNNQFIFQAKQRGEQKKNNFLVPYDKDHPEICFAKQVIQYLKLVHKSQPELGSNSESPMFLRARKEGFGCQPMGKDMLASIGKEVAKELGLENPNTYTGHCFRRSSATEAANKGATSVDLKRHFGWLGEQTALKYLDETKERPRKMAELLTGVKAVPSTPASSTSAVSGLPANVPVSGAPVSGEPMSGVSGEPVSTTSPAAVTTRAEATHITTATGQRISISFNITL